MKQLIDKSFRLSIRLINRARAVMLYIFGGSVSSEIRVYGRYSFIGDLRNLNLGRYVSVNEGVHFNLGAKITIGEYTHLSTNVHLHTGRLMESNLNKHFNQPITIGKRCWIASGVVISAGVNITDDVIVGANSVVTQNIKCPGFYAGCPARLIKENVKNEH